MCLVSQVWSKWRGGSAASVVDPVLRDGTGSIRDILRCIQMGLLCVQESPGDRPTMGSIALMLSSATVTMPVPSQPAFVESTHLLPNISEASSRNEISITHLNPR